MTRLARIPAFALVLLVAMTGSASAVYEGYVWPNAAVAPFPIQSRLFQQDVQIIADGARGNGVVFSAGACALLEAATPAMTTRITTGCTIVVNFVTQAVATGSFTHSAAHATLNRLDIAGSTSAGVKTVVTGTAAASPLPPTIPDNFVVFAFVYVPAADTAITATQITDKRIFVIKRDALSVSTHRPEEINGTSTLVVSSLTSRNVTYFTVPATIAASQISVYYSAAGTPGTAKLCVYTADGTTKVLDGTVTPSAAAVKSVAVSGTLTPGGYYFVTGCATTCSVTIVGGPVPANTATLWGAGTPAGKAPWAGTVTHASGLCDTTLGTVTGATVVTPAARIDN